MKVWTILAVLALVLVAMAMADAPAPAATPATPAAKPAPKPAAKKGGKAAPALKRGTPGKPCSAFGKDCATCTEVHNCAWTKKGKCIGTDTPLYAKLQREDAVYDACPKVFKLGNKLHIIKQTRPNHDVVQPLVGAADTEPVIATADVVAKLPPGSQVVSRGPEYSFIAKKAQPAVEQGYLEPEWA